MHRLFRTDPYRHRSVGEHLVVVEYEGLVELPVIAGRAAHDRYPESGHPVHAVEEFLLVAQQSIGQHHQRLVRRALRAGRIAGAPGEVVAGLDRIGGGAIGIADPEPVTGSR